MAIPRQFSGLSLRTVPYSSALRQGTGVNPIHSVRDGQGRNTAADATGLLVDPDLVEAGLGGSDDFGFSYEDQSYTYSAAESPFETGTADRPPVGSEQDSRTDTAEEWPSWAPLAASGVPGGEYVRSIERGAIASNTPTAVPRESAAGGWENKITGGVIEPGTGISDPSQYTMKTSMQQLRRTRAGSQRGGGSASPYEQPITTRVPGQKIKVYSDSPDRKLAMTPVTQDQIIRPFFLRTMGTGHAADMQPNAMYQSTPLQRVAPPDPYQGETPSASAGVYGYTNEDGLY